MKKIIYLLSVLIVAFGLFYACDQQDSNLEDLSKSENKIYSKTPKYANIGVNISDIFTDGGNVNITDEQRSFIINKCAKNQLEKQRFNDNLAYIGIFTKSNFNKNKIDNFDGISLYIFDGNLMEHHFYQKSGDKYIENLNLKFKCDAIMKKDTSFITFYSKLYKGSKVSHYLSEFPLAKNIHHKEGGEDYIDREFLEFQTSIYGEYLKLSSQPDAETLGAIESAMIGGGYCSCGGGIGTCLADNSCRQTSGGCSVGGTQARLGNSYSAYFNDTLLYEIRDEILENSIVGKKYYAFYYYTSLPEITEQLSISELAEIATTLPTIYSIYNRIKNSEYQNLVFTGSEKNQVLNILNIYKSKNISINFRQIIDDVIADLNHLSGKSVGYLNQEIY